ncbi:hypothetical protein LCGC14_1621000, partial [marine sediment metagenome]
MARFAYQVRDARGGAATGMVTAGSKDEATRMLRSEGHVIVSLTEETDGANSRAAHVPASRAKAKRDDVIFFANQLAVMVDTGVPLAEGMETIADNAENEGFRYVLRTICSQVRSGVEFSAALAHYPRIFGRLFVAMVRASEASGTLGKMLERVAKYLEQERRVRRQVKGAMAYPMGMLGFCILVVVAMLVFVLPRFETIYAGKSAALPLPTRMLLGMSSAVVDYWPLILGVIGLMAVGGWMYFRRPEGKRVLDHIRLRLPILGRMFAKGCLTKALRTLATMVSTGVSMLDSLEITADVAGIAEYRRDWRRMGNGLREGASLAAEMEKSPMILPFVTQM